MASAIGSRALRAALAAVILASAAPARAEVSAADKASAEALFEHAKLLMKEGKFAEACPKFAESLRLDAGIGTTLYLADCYEKNGQTASAWAEFVDAAGLAKAAGQTDREKKARDRAAALEPRLMRVSITLAPGAEVPGIQVKRDGTAVPKALWGTPVPLDPGEHAIEVSAPGKTLWSLKLQVKASEVSPMSVVIPVLKDLPPPPPPKVEPSKVEPPKAEPEKAKVEPTKAEPAKEPVLKSGGVPEALVREDGSPGRVVGYTVLGLGLATAGVGGIIGLVTLLKASESNTNCRPNGACNPAGADARNTALGLAKDANITLVAGGAGFVTGLIILLATKGAERSPSKYTLRVAPMVGSRTGGLGVEGAF